MSKLHDDIECFHSGLIIDNNPKYVPDGIIETAPGIYAMRMVPYEEPIKLG